MFAVLQVEAVAVLFPVLLSGGYQGSFCCLTVNGGCSRLTCRFAVFDARRLLRSCLLCRTLRLSSFCLLSALAGGFVVLPAAFPFYDASRLSRSILLLYFEAVFVLLVVCR